MLGTIAWFRSLVHLDFNRDAPQSLNFQAVSKTSRSIRWDKVSSHPHQSRPLGAMELLEAQPASSLGWTCKIFGTRVCIEFVLQPETDATWRSKRTSLHSTNQSLQKKKYYKRKWHDISEQHRNISGWTFGGRLIDYLIRSNQGWHINTWSREME